MSYFKLRGSYNPNPYKIIPYTSNNVDLEDQRSYEDEEKNSPLGYGENGWRNYLNEDEKKRYIDLEASQEIYKNNINKLISIKKEMGRMIYQANLRRINKKNNKENNFNSTDVTNNVNNNNSKLIEETHNNINITFTENNNSVNNIQGFSKTGIFSTQPQNTETTKTNSNNDENWCGDLEKIFSFLDPK